MDFFDLKKTIDLID